MARIVVTASPHSRAHPVQIGGFRVTFPIGQPVEVPEAMVAPVMEVLGRAPGVTAQRVAESGKAAEPVASPDSTDPVLDLLDQPVGDLTAALSELTLAELDRLLTAEHNGNTRKTAVQAIEAEIAGRKTEE
jgi:hypothetical protein